jgi:5-methylcytosine-specific restriction endonuclease McrA
MSSGRISNNERKSSPDQGLKDPRRVFTQKQRAEMFARADGKCEICNEKIVGRWIAGHILAHNLGGKTCLENAQVECVACERAKLKADAGQAAKAKRQAGETGQQARRKKRGSSFANGFKRKLPTKKNPYGETVRRDN